ncbi:hypothetical protein ACEPPN_007664 [Leptodophora sp. 'Broadleaf-Isolate-01']
MPETRSLKKIASQDVDALPRKPRARKPNANSLQAFSEAQEPVNRNRKRPRANTTTEEPNEPESGPAPVTPSKDQDVVEVSSGPGTPIKQSPLAHRKKSAPEFNPNYEFDKDPHFVVIPIIPVIDGSAKSAVTFTIDINQIERATWVEMCKEVYKRYVKKWTEERELYGAEKPKLGPWKILIPGSKGFTAEVSNEEEWEEILVALRVMAY